MRARQVVRLCVPLLLVWQRRVGAMPRARIALRRRRARACNGHKIICGCISLVNTSAMHRLASALHLCAGHHSSAATRCFLAVMVASVFFIAVDKKRGRRADQRLLVFPSLELYHVYARPFSPTEGSHGTFNPFSVR
jgi:hypothetical protein